MNVVATVKALNQRAAREKWYHVCDPTLAFSDPFYERFLDLWRSKAGDRPMPKRSDMSLRDLKDVLRHLIVLERVERMPSCYRVRLLGTGLTSMTGDHTGKMLAEAVPAEHLPRWVECCDLVLDGGSRCVSWGAFIFKAKNISMPKICSCRLPTITTSRPSPWGYAATRRAVPRMSRPGKIRLLPFLALFSSHFLSLVVVA